MVIIFYSKLQEPGAPHFTMQQVAEMLNAARQVAFMYCAGTRINTNQLAAGKWCSIPSSYLPVILVKHQKFKETDRKSVV